MSYTVFDVPYMCDDDCEMSGCPGHTMAVGFESTSDVYTVKSDTERGGGIDFSADRGAMQALLKGFELLAGPYTYVEDDLQVLHNHPHTESIMTIGGEQHKVLKCEVER